MKTLHGIRIPLFFLLMGWISVQGQVSESEVPGDHFSLEGALEVFKKSASPEEFERQLNSPDAKLNNLDLNGDGYIDYIRVIDRNEGNVHAFILQAIVSKTESQDVAVIALEKLANGKAVLQITGDADIYGIETIIEPTQEVRVNAGTTTARTVENVWTWPSVQYVYSPYYAGWVSPWYYDMQPMWWRPWRPVAYVVYRPWWDSYRPRYTVCYTHRVVYAQHIYRPYRTTSVVVYNRHHDRITHYRSSRNVADDSRGRNNQGRSYDNTRNRHNSYFSTERSRSNQQPDRSTSPRSDWSYSREREERKSTNTRNELYSGNRPATDFNKETSSPSREFQRQGESRKSQRSTDVNQATHNREARPAQETRTMQKHPDVQRERIGSSREKELQRSVQSERNKVNDQTNGKRRGRE
ncbi:MAG: hypothetical protein JNM57_06940 [Cyclobacteriaceae bacterium]|nr:hypothetical protein [Cyclobacteriaceae bacterium]